MKETTKLLAGVAGVGLIAALAVVLSRFDDASSKGGAEPAGERAEAGDEGAGDAFLAAESTVAEQPEPVARVPLGESFVQPEAERVAVVLLRWPDEAPIANTRVRIFGNPGPALADYETSSQGRVDLPGELAHQRIELSVQIEGFEAARLRVGPFADKRNSPRISMRPTTGWYGRVRTFDGKAAANVTVSGWWIEAARPYEGTLLTFKPKKDKQKESRDVPEGDKRADLTALAARFVVSRGLVAATGRTNAEGYYYVEALGAEVHGQLTLAARGEDDYSSDVLRLPLPSGRAALPELILHRPIPSYGMVVDEFGDPLADAVVLPQFAQGWSVDLQPVYTDEGGRFEFTPPAEALVVTAEKVGYRMDPTELTKVESLDGLWKELVALTPAAWSGGGLEAFTSQRSHLSRTRSFVALDALQVEARIVMSALPVVKLEVVDAAELEENKRVPIEGAQVDVRYGGLDAQELRVLTSLDGRASFANADVEWQPVVVTVAAYGYHPHVFALRPNSGSLRIALVPIEPPADGGRAEGRLPNGLVLGPAGAAGNATIVAYRVEDYEQPNAKPAWTIETDSDGGFRYSAPEDVPLTKLFYLFAYRGEGSARLAGKFGPIDQRQLANDEVTVIDVEPAIPVSLNLYQLDAGDEYRVHAGIAPFPGAQEELADVIDIRSTDWRALGDSLVYVPYGWRVRAHVEVALQANAPLVDFIRAGRRRQSAFDSLATVWTDWQRVSELAIVHFAVPSSVLHFDVAAHVDFGGSVGSRPFGSPAALFVAARGSQGHWVAPIDGNGWFDFCDMPAGSYDLMLYSPPDPGAGYALDGEGQLFGLLEANCRYSRFDLVLEWVEPLDADLVEAEYEYDGDSDSNLIERLRALGYTGDH